jgi:hypothetical protein
MEFNLQNTARLANNKLDLDQKKRRPIANTIPLRD